VARQHKPTAESAAFESLLHGLTMLCKPDTEIPRTLHYDRNRIQQLREENQDLVYLRICIDSFDQLTRNLIGHSLPVMHEELQNRLLAVTDGEPGKSVTEIWHDQIDNLAVEVTTRAYMACSGSVSPIAEVYDNTACKIQRDFNDKYGVLEEELLRKLEEESCQHASSFQNLSTREIAEAQREWQQQMRVESQLRQIPCLGDMARRLAHIGVLHWRIWSDLAYLEFDEERGDEDLGTSHPDPALEGEENIEWNDGPIDETDDTTNWVGNAAWR
jgi:hypothetical protein